MRQLDLFEHLALIEKFSRVYQAMDHLWEQFGKHTACLGCSSLAYYFAQRLGVRGDTPQRTGRLVKGETKRQRLAIPICMRKYGKQQRTKPALGKPRAGDQAHYSDAANSKAVEGSLG